MVFGVLSFESGEQMMGPENFSQLRNEQIDQGDHQAIPNNSVKLTSRAILFF